MSLYGRRADIDFIMEKGYAKESASAINTAPVPKVERNGSAIKRETTDCIDDLLAKLGD